ncbi:dTDP-4-dehydrorhamnose reductase [Pantoea allii]|uniref:dTDP-4-dehydrorhamnose reductase n=1 Tax=Pantoea allii TaxID=574096 RepID=A0ABS6V9B6_9GAMM|nr:MULTISPECIES: dTDP-4-dehydrorhamnose reductase [Pantoea]MBW1212672.1 dTDP-4-dehydrorhamnose reductase [Pantoea allii]MBW1255690.1 dTDP-4-dehydrorhamnose reductase [Pantoea allii]MBW1264767.1 dTDP-4-dehydrorhamnose reductase [Pantoea allii]MBW1286884.1 dTDP-4-dehydrorhamnose reductase [Pantoea allii]OAE08938.1 NAD(P)-dependent oxidoreductase [Pantoea sp. OXWO6B1]
MRVLLTGAYGQLGRCILDRFPTDWITLACGSAELDITKRSAIELIVKKFRPDVIMNAAAYTAVDKAETDRVRAMKINALGAENIALVARQYGSRLIHISTDYVFDGRKKTPYNEDDSPCPINFYGLSKWEGETRILNILPNAVILRASWIFSEYGDNFVQRILKLAKSHGEIKVVNDQFGCPTYGGDVALAMIKLAERVESQGIYHFCGDQKVSWCEFAQTIFIIAQYDVIVKGIDSGSYPTNALRPTNSVLSCDKIRDLGISPSNWEAALRLVVPTPAYC